MNKLPESQNNESLHNTDSHRDIMHSDPIKVVALYEVIKGFAAVLAAGALWRWHERLSVMIDLARSAWNNQFGELLKPQVDSAIRIAMRADENWQLFLVLIMSYALARFVVAVGLWRDKMWSYWVTVLGYAVFIPMEVYYLITRPFDWFKLLILFINLVVVYIVFKKMRGKGLI